MFNAENKTKNIASHTLITLWTWSLYEPCLNKPKTLIIIGQYIISKTWHLHGLWFSSNLWTYCKSTCHYNISLVIIVDKKIWETPACCYGFHGVTHQNFASESCSIHTWNDNLGDLNAFVVLQCVHGQRVHKMCPNDTFSLS